MNKLFLLLSAVVICFGFEAFSKISYLSPKGSGANPGTRQLPWASLQKSIWRIKPGDTLVIRGGLYREAAYADFESNPDSKVTTIKAEPNETPVFDGRIPTEDAVKPSWTKTSEGYWTTFSTGKWKWIDGLWVDGTFYKKLDDKNELKPGTWFHPKKSDEITVYFENGRDPKNAKLEFRLEAMITVDSPFWNVDGVTAQYFNQYGLGAWKTHHVTIRNCEANHNGGAGIETDDATNLLIENNRTAYNGTEGGPGWASGIHIFGTTSPDNIVRANISHHNWDPSDHHTDGNGFSIDKGYSKGGAEVYNNIAYANGGRGIDIMATSNVRLHHNTFYNDSLDPNMSDQGEVSIYGKEAATGLVISDNILLATQKDPPITVWKDLKPSDIKSDYNVLFNTDNHNLVFALRQDGNVKLVGLSKWQNLSTHETHSLNSDPKLESLAKFKFEPLGGSPVIQRGSAQNVPKTDVFGHMRSTNTIGAVESTSKNLAEAKPSKTQRNHP